MPRERDLIAGMTDYTGVGMEDILAHLHTWQTMTRQAIDILVRHRRDVGCRLEMFEDPTGVLYYIDHFCDLFDRYALDFGRLVEELPRGVRQSHVETILQIYSSSRLEDKECVDFKHEFIQHGLRNEQARPILDAVYAETRDTVIDYRDLSNLATRLRALSTSSPQSIEVVQQRLDSSSIGKTTLKALLTIFSILGVIATLSPDEAISNLSKWAHMFGISGSPKWLSRSHALQNTILYATSVVVFLLAIVWVFIPLYKERKRKGLEIIFDGTNPGRQFWSSIVSTTNGRNAPGIEYKIKIRNRTDKTLYEVKATTENLGPLGATPSNLIFEQTKEITCSLDPNASAFVKLFFVPFPVGQPGTLSGNSASAYGPVKVTVSARNIPAVERTFQFNPYKEPMIFDK